jgi:hypothetical protein
MVANSMVKKTVARFPALRLGTFLGEGRGVQQQIAEVDSCHLTVSGKIYVRLDDAAPRHTA